MTNYDRWNPYGTGESDGHRASSYGCPPGIKRGWEVPEIWRVFSGKIIEQNDGFSNAVFDYRMVCTLLYPVHKNMLYIVLDSHRHQSPPSAASSPNLWDISTYMHFLFTTCHFWVLHIQTSNFDRLGINDWSTHTKQQYHETPMRLFLWSNLKFLPVLYSHSVPTLYCFLLGHLVNLNFQLFNAILNLLQICWSLLNHPFQACFPNVFTAFFRAASVAFRRRQKVLDEALALAAERGTPLKDLLISLTAARQARWINGRPWVKHGVHNHGRFLYIFLWWMVNKRFFTMTHNDQ